MFPDSGWVKASGKQLWRVGGLDAGRSKAVGLAQKGRAQGKTAPPSWAWSRQYHPRMRVALVLTLNRGQLCDDIWNNLPVLTAVEPKS